MFSSQKWLLLVVAVIAFVAGMIYFQHHPSSGATQSATTQLFKTTFKTPEGIPTRLNTNDQWLLINFWATWCPSCVHEIPLLNEFALKNKNRLIINGIALDEAELVKKFMQTTPIHYPVLIADLSFLTQLESLGNPSGGLPFSLLLNPQGHIVAQKVGDFQSHELVQWQRMIDAK